MRSTFLSLFQKPIRCYKPALISNLSHIFSSIADHYDVKMPCHLILSKLADKCPSAVLAGNSPFYFYFMVLDKPDISQLNLPFRVDHNYIFT